jgi:hypothetical protein
VLLSLDPIVAQLVSMKLGPIEHQSKGPARKPSLDDLQGFYGELRFVRTIYRVKVWRRVIVVVHAYNDSQKDAERRHRMLILRYFGIFVGGE